MPALPPVLAVLRHALADPLSAAAVKAEVLAARLGREAPALAPRARDLGADLAVAGRLLDLLAALESVAEEAPEETPLGELVPSPAPEAGEAGARPLVRLRRAAAADAIRRLVSFGAARGAEPRVEARASSSGAEVRVAPLGPAPPSPEKLLLLPRDVGGAEELFLARAAAEADGGTLRLTERGGSLEASLVWPSGEGR